MAQRGDRDLSRRGLGARARGTARHWPGSHWSASLARRSLVHGHRHPRAGLARSRDSIVSALIGWPAGERYLDFEGDITTLRVRTHPAAVDAVRDLLARTANPERPNEVDVSRPSMPSPPKPPPMSPSPAFSLALGAVALLVGGIGVANTMVISVLERRAEIGLRRSQGATRRHIRIQFFGEALLLALLGGGSGILDRLAGHARLCAAARLARRPPSVGGCAAAWGRLCSSAASLASTPLIRAARLAPTEALSAA